MLYFAYGSNMALSRIKQRTPSAKRIGTYILSQHALKFHMLSTDGSGKCDAHYTGDVNDMVVGALYELDDKEKPILDAAEGLGQCYDLKDVEIINHSGERVVAQMYFALRLAPNLAPYDWYLRHVVIGAREINVPGDYLKSITSIKANKDSDEARAALQFAVHH